MSLNFYTPSKLKYPLTTHRVQHLQQQRTQQLLGRNRGAASPWVEDEVESALERERRENRMVLFPIRIDDAVMDTDVAWGVHLRQKRHIGEFSRWKDHDAYKKAFDRLLRDLKADARSEQNKNTPHDGGETKLY